MDIPIRLNIQDQVTISLYIKRVSARSQHLCTAGVQVVQVVALGITYIVVQVVAIQRSSSSCRPLSPCPSQCSSPSNNSPVCTFSMNAADNFFELDVFLIAECGQQSRYRREILSTVVSPATGRTNPRNTGSRKVSWFQASIADGVGCCRPPN